MSTILPCKDCICLGVCKARYMTHLQIAERRARTELKMPTSVREKLERYCKILSQYTTCSNGHIKFSNVKLFHFFMQNKDLPQTGNQYK